MKKIPVWLVLFLTVVTIGLYFIYWLAQRRQELLKDEASGRILNWTWLLALPIVIGGAFLAAIVYTLMGVFDAISVDQAMTGFAWSIILVAVLPAIIGVWWFWYFGHAVEVRTQGRMPRAWTLPLYIFTGPFVIAFHQYYFNRLHENKKSQSYQVSPGLIAITAFVAILSIVSMISSVANFDTTLNETRRSIETSQAQFREYRQLSERSLACDQAFTAEYPDGRTNENAESYDAKAAECEQATQALEAAYERLLQSQ